MSENTFWCVLWLGLATVIGGTVTACVLADAYRDCVAMRHGYSRTAVPGWTGPVWVKGSAQ